MGAVNVNASAGENITSIGLGRRPEATFQANGAKRPCGRRRAADTIARRGAGIRRVIVPVTTRSPNDGSARIRLEKPNNIRRI